MSTRAIYFSAIYIKQYANMARYVCRPPQNIQGLVVFNNPTPPSNVAVVTGDFCPKAFQRNRINEFDNL